ncbi:MAG: recombination-associated protein RdgC [Gammaproteobacteria bacterium]|nr:recombination-associated protein RdgC [Gammaproteobacteria bacterium]
MWFKNARVYRLQQQDSIRLDQLEAQLEEQAFTPCGKSEQKRVGWVSALGKHGEMLSHVVGATALLAMKSQERVLPAGVVNELLSEKVAEIEAEEHRKVYKKEKTQIKDELVLELTPRAFCRSKWVTGYIDLAAGWIVIDASSASAAEDFLGLLRESLGTLSVVPWSTQQTPSETLTHWLTHGVEGKFELGTEAELVSRAIDGGSAKIKDQPLFGDEIEVLLDAGKRVKKLALIWDERIKFIVDEELALKRIKLTDVYEDAVELSQSDDVAAQLDHEFVLMTGVFREWLSAVVEAMGGLN